MYVTGRMCHMLCERIIYRRKLIVNRLENLLNWCRLDGFSRNKSFEHLIFEKYYRNIPISAAHINLSRFI